MGHKCSIPQLLGDSEVWGIKGKAELLENDGVGSERGTEEIIVPSERRRTKNDPYPFWGGCHRSEEEKIPTFGKDHFQPVKYKKGKGEKEKWTTQSLGTAAGKALLVQFYLCGERK